MERGARDQKVAGSSPDRHLTTNSSCDCGEEKKHLNSTVYIAHVLHMYIKTPYSNSLANLLNITTLLQGDPNISSNMNSLIFKAALDSIAESGHFLPSNDKLS